jgi:hypothetical protein
MVVTGLLITTTAFFEASPSWRGENGILLKIHLCLITLLSVQMLRTYITL